jgi:signal transduction histidine kinase
VEPRTRVSLDAVLDEVMQDLGRTYDDAGATLRRKPLPQVFGYRSQLRQLLQNLLTNAVKFHGPLPPEVHVDAVVEADVIVFRVQDNGIGIEARHHARIFEVFQRLHTREEYPGTGIGLAICQKVAKQHGGSIRVDSTPGKGSLFEVRFPRLGEEENE